ncbi:Cytochrome C oxidase subunit IV [Mucilaginibacter gossypiicola]|uniref:Cytochrome C oxidase subunit IV n=1 Tax=Mucilaginibacter gossypiicola TaxID=551995 RepID=A0A1H8MYU8_9SPHI|nr:cytochrome C oxidase subunit IV family protein [Mucilaginibacter gossypiicola]SEO22433.1 Cytochrome C oxidase subunit IV [Mucilaginibacter gossypiicola]
MSAESHEVHHDGEHDTMSKKRIWQVAGILTFITCIEFIIALAIVPNHPDLLKYANPVYIVLTLFKAFYIVAYFMHLKFEKMGLILSLVIPIIFIIGLILVLTNESHHWVDLRPVF